MKRIRALAMIALVGVLLVILVVVDTNRPPPKEAGAPPERVPFPTYVVGTGLTETGRGNVSIGTAMPGVVRAVSVRVGDRVAAGDVLFRTDDRDLQAQWLVARADVLQARAALEKPRHRLDFLEHLQRLDRGAISVETISNARDDVDTAAAQLATAEATVQRIGIDIDRSIVRAPTAGKVLQVNVRPGEFATGGAANPLMLIGDDTRMFLRVDIDENDAWRVRQDARAVAFVRGNPGLSIPLRFEYIEPYVTPKTSLTGQGTERTDVRVLQVIYSFERGSLPVYLGQQMDAFIQAPSAGLDAADGPR